MSTASDSNGGPTRTAADSGGVLVDRIYQSLLEQILTGKFPSGTILSELALAREMGASRTPVHDAIRQLAKDGLVVRENRRRARVAGFTPDDVYEIFELRKMLEGPAAELAAGRMDARQLAPLRAIAEELKVNLHAPDFVARWAYFDEVFHHTIAQACGNRRLAFDIARYHLLHKGINRVSTDAISLRKALDEHIAILDALEQRDGAAARQRMTDHIAYWQTFFIRSLERLATSRQAESEKPLPLKRSLSKASRGPRKPVRI